MNPVQAERGFSLLEVVIALAIVSLKLGVLLEIQASSLDNAARARDITIGTLLARSKMIDIEQSLFDDGMTLNDVEEKGDFSEEGYPYIKWKYSLQEIDMDFGSLAGLCEMLGEDMAAQCDGLLGMLAGPVQGITDEMARSMRFAEMTVTWPKGRYTESIEVRTLVTREDYNFAPPTPIMPNDGGIDPAIVPPGAAGGGLMDPRMAPGTGGR